MEDSIWYLYETKKGNGPFADELKNKPIKNGNYFEYDKNKKIVIYGSYNNNREDALFVYFNSYF